MGDIPEELLAEEEEVQGGLVAGIFGTATGILSSYGWYILAAGAGGYYLWSNYSQQFLGTGNAGNRRLSSKEAQEFQSKEEARQKYVTRLQEQYEADAAARAEKQKQMDEEKRKARLAELEQLELKGGRRLETESKPKSSAQSFRPEYNPLMGDTGSNRVCFRSSGGRSGG